MLSTATLLVYLFLLSAEAEAQVLLPFETTERSDVRNMKLTEIGVFGVIRKARKGIPEHLHTGVDIRRSENNYENCSIYAIAEGIVISKRTDGPYAQVIIEHPGDKKFWTVYEHIAEIKVELFEEVNANTILARFFNEEELQRYGWQFDHFHFEVLKQNPIRIKPSEKLPQRLFNSFTLSCYTEDQLYQYFYNPVAFLSKHL